MNFNEAEFAFAAGIGWGMVLGYILCALVQRVLQLSQDDNPQQEDHNDTLR